jgi:hypothetical protein
VFESRVVNEEDELVKVDSVVEDVGNSHVKRQNSKKASDFFGTSSWNCGRSEA